MDSLPDSVDAADLVRFDPPADVAAAAAARLKGRHALVLTDYDGTLSEIVDKPSGAVVSTEVLEAFDALPALPHLTLGVVSGRRMNDVIARVGPSAAYVAGLHGLEISGRGEEFSHRALDEVEPVIARLGADAERRLAWCPGCFLENKRWSLTCHVRMAPPNAAERALEEFEALAEPYLESRVLRLLIGSKATELLPAADWHKGRAVNWIRARVARDTRMPVSVLYLGDDRTDEDAFTSLAVDDFAVAVGTRPHSHMIDARLEGPRSVGQFFLEFARRRR
jgi:trehalose-phosphatase